MKAFEETEIAVTGGAGFIGSHLCKTLLEHGAKVIAYDDLSTGKIAYIERLLEKGL
ncbi:MAG: NAD-dependent epimerase/dehydratase family protein, partial [Candidatus Bathyarchaeota archaeon]